MRQDSKTILIGGITGGIGSALAKRLSGQGWTVHGYARNRESLDALADDLPGIHTHQADAHEPEALAQLVGEITSSSPLHAYVHCIGSIFIRNLEQTKPTDFDEVVRVNLYSAFNAMRAVIGPMRKNGQGSIVLLSTAAARAGLPGHEAIAAAKAGVEALAQSAAASYASHGIRVNAVAPGLVETPLSQPVISSAKAREISERMHPLGRIGQPDEIASLLSWLVSDDALWVTGQVWAPDGGLSTLRERPRA